MSRRLARALAALPVLLLTAWAYLALSFRVPGPAWLRHAVALLFVVLVLAILATLRPLGRKALALAVPFALLFLWWGSIEPSNDRDWSPEVARLPTGEVRRRRSGGSHPLRNWAIGDAS